MQNSSMCFPSINEMKRRQAKCRANDFRESSLRLTRISYENPITQMQFVLKHTLSLTHIHTHTHLHPLTHIKDDCIPQLQFTNTHIKDWAYTHLTKLQLKKPQSIF